jgi:hypothetical protein
MTPPGVPRRRPDLLLVAALAVPLAFCVARLDLDLWYDEAFTLQTFVSHGFETIVTDYSYPNNHVFYSLVALPFSVVSDANVVLRLPSLLLSVGTLLLTWRLVRRAVSPEAAACAVAWLGLNQLFLNFAVQVRGYALSMCLAAALGNLVLRQDPDPWWRRGMVVATVAAFLYTLPTNVVFAVPLAAAAVGTVVLRGEGARHAAREAMLWGAGAVVAIVCYTPIIDAVLAQRGAPASSRAVLDFVVHVLRLTVRDAPWIWVLWPLGLAAWLARRRADPWPGRGDARELLVLVVFGVLGPLAVLFALRPAPLFERTMLPLLPFLAAANGWLLWETLEAVRRRLVARAPRSSTAACAILLLLAVYLPSLLTHPSRLAEYRDRTFAQDGYYNYYNARFCPSCVVRHLQRTVPADQEYVVVYDRRGYFVLNHYFARLGFPQARLASAGGRPSESKDVVAWVYYVVPTLATWEDLEERLGVSRDVLARFPLVQDFGYFKLYRSPAPLRFTRWF